MKSDFTFVVCADIRYLPELVGCLNSLDYVGNKQDVHFFGYKIPSEVLDQFKLLNYQVIFHEITDEEIELNHGLSEVVCRKRYFYANQIGREYRAVCVLDADMVFTRDPVQFFVIAEKTGYVLGASKEQNKVYDDGHHTWHGQFILEKGYYNPVDLCNCPLFVDTKIWGNALDMSYQWFVDGFPETNMKCPDMDCMNLSLIYHGSADKTIVMPNVQWLSTNEQALKLYQRVINDHGKIKTETGTPVFSYHGQYYHPRWRNTQLRNRDHCAKGYFKASGDSLECSNNIAQGAMNLLYENFKKMLDWKIIIEKKNYRHPEKDTGFLDVKGEEDSLG